MLAIRALNNLQKNGAKVSICFSVFDLTHSNSQPIRVSIDEESGKSVTSLKNFRHSYETEELY